MQALPGTTILIILVSFLPACGKKGDPLPPLRPTPAAITGLRLAQRGNQVEITFTAPRSGADGGRLPVLDLELFVADGEGDFLKRARSRRFKAAPGEAFTEIEPLPAPGTYLRAAARAIARGHRGSLGEPARLVVTSPLATPTELTVLPSAQGVTLSWRGDVPAPLPTPTPVPPSAPPLSAETAPRAGTAPPAQALPSAATAPPVVAPPMDSPAAAPAPPASAAPPSGPAAVPPARPDPAPRTAASVPKPTPTPTPFAPGFFIYRRTMPAPHGAPLKSTAVQETTFADAVRPGEAWCYEVRAVASALPLVESAPSNEVCLEVKDLAAPAPPAGLTALAQDDGVETRWSPSPEPDVVAYRVYRTVRGGSRERIAEIPAPGTRHLDADAPKSRLRYVVTAVDAAGNESAPGPPAEVRP